MPHLLSVGSSDGNIAWCAELLRGELSVRALHDIPSAVAINSDVGFAGTIVISDAGMFVLMPKLTMPKLAVLRC